MGLQTYHKKRRFDVTPEPRGHMARGKGNAFVIQKHAARRLHYDLRLELDGVMKSWAVTRGPSLIPGEKRLAVQVEDHPIEYNGFEGTIPQGEYGGGTVMIWDRGHWYPEGDPHKGLQKGHLDFSLEGDKLRGRWHLVRMRRRPGESKDSWLLFKATDAEAREQDAPDILEEAPLSAASGRSMDEIAQGKGRKRVWHSTKTVAENVRAGATRGLKQARAGGATPRPTQRAPQRGRKPADRTSGTGRTSSSKRRDDAETGRPAPLPEFMPPALATLREDPPTGQEWVHEIKFDGYRIQARLDRGKVRLLTRKGLDWTEKFPNIAAAVRELAARDALIDGEVVVEDASGISSFSALQAALKEGEKNRFVYYVFDLLHRDRRSLAQLPLDERKAELTRLVGDGNRGPIRYSEHFEESGATILRHACNMGLEGIVSKRRDAPYCSGRSDVFVKTKCANAQEFVVGGYTPSTALPNAIGALLAGYYDNGQLIYAGRIGTGYTRVLARDLWKRLRALDRAKPPFDQIPREEARRRDTHWVDPRMVIESQFRGWTADGLVRQAAFKGVREDKPAREVFREEPAVKQTHETNSGPASARQDRSRASHADGASRAQAAAARSRSVRTNDPVRFTNPDRIYWADVGISKQDLAAYYYLVWPWMAPHLVDRPLALVRCPEGTEGECFFQKHASAGLEDKHLKTIIDKNRRQVVAVEGIDGLLSLVQAGVLEIHVRGSLLTRLDVCDRIVFDIDPGPDVEWAEVVAAARDVRTRLAALDLTSFVKLSGGKGLHVVLPIEGADWKTAKNFAGAVATAMNADAPDRYVAKITKSLRVGKIFVDYFRNSLEQTSVAAYSTRARAGAPVSVPVSWDELARTKGGNHYSVVTLPKRLEKLSRDPWEEMTRCKQKLPDPRAMRRR